MAHAISIDPERKIEGRHQRGHRGSTGTERPTGSSSSASCNPIRGAAATLDPGQVCGNPGSLMQSCFSHSSSGPPRPLSPTPPQRVYHVWPGKNAFLFDGRVIFGPGPEGVVFTAMAVIFSEWVFLAYILDRASSHPSLISAFSLILASTVIASMLLTATRDPGIMPRNQVSPLEEAGTRTAGSTPSRFIVVNGVEMRMRLCRICKIFRPPRSSHCALCDNCVDKFDHHSIWISQCIGLRNYRIYLVLVCSALAFYAFIFAFSVRRISAGSTLPITFIFATLSFMATCFLAYLLAFNAFLVAKNKTSHEWHKGRQHTSPNPYDEGTMGNIRECLFQKLPPPRVDFRAVVEPNM